VELLKVIRSAKPHQFAKHKQEFFPIVCTLVRVQSEEIRAIVQEIFTLQVAPMIGVKID